MLGNVPGHTASAQQSQGSHLFHFLKCILLQGGLGAGPSMEVGTGRAAKEEAPVWLLASYGPSFA